MRVSRRFVDVEIDRHHKLETRECAIQHTTVRRRQHWISRECDERLNLSRTLGQNLFGKRSHGQLTPEFRQLSYTTVPARKTPAWGDRLRRREWIKRR